jgi:hypothetical protein
MWHSLIRNGRSRARNDRLDLSHLCQIRLNLLGRAIITIALLSSVFGLRVGAQVASLRCPIFRSAQENNMALFYLRIQEL